MPVVFGMLQSKVWGWIIPKDAPVINGHELAPFGISIVAYLIVLGSALLWWFYRRKNSLKQLENPLLQVSMFLIAQLRSGLCCVYVAVHDYRGSLFCHTNLFANYLGYDALPNRP